MNHERRRRRHGRRTSWVLISATHLWWCPGIKRWVTPEECPKHLGASNWRHCRTAQAARRAALALSKLGGGELIRNSVAFDARLGRLARRQTVWTIRPS